MDRKHTTCKRVSVTSVDQWEEGEEGSQTFNKFLYVLLSLTILITTVYCIVNKSTVFMAHTVCSNMPTNANYLISRILKRHTFRMQILFVNL